MSLQKRKTRKFSLPKGSKSAAMDVGYTTADLPILRRKRTAAFNRLIKANEIGVRAESDESQRDLFFAYHQDVKKIHSDFEDAHYAILSLTNDSEDEEESKQEQFDELFYNVLAIHRNLNKPNLQVESAQSVNQNISTSNIRLPKLTLPTFSGCVKQFPEYIDTFNAIIHNSPSLKNTEKFHYLISSLNGDALTLVRGFPITTEHYIDAYNALISRYQDKRELAFTCWRDILNINFNLNKAHEFRHALDTIDENLSILRKINQPVDKWDFILNYHILSKLDAKTRRDFEENHADVEFSSYAQLKRFLHARCEALLRDTHFSDPTKTSPSHNFASKQWTKPVSINPNKRLNSSHSLVTSSNSTSDAKDSQQHISKYLPKCSFCKEAHFITQCKQFIDKSVDDRMAIANDKKWCFNCLKSSHQLKNCVSNFTCQRCRHRHHTLLHRDKPVHDAEPTTSSTLVAKRESSRPHTVLLATAIIQVRDALGRLQSFRALFDTGSQNNFMTEEAVRRLKLVCTPSTASVSGLGDVSADISGIVHCSVVANNGTEFHLEMQAIRKICDNQPIAKLNTSGWSQVKTLPLADPDFDIPAPVDILLGADVFADSLLSQRIKGTSTQPLAFESVFGWLLLGKAPLAGTTLLSARSRLDSELVSIVQRVWEIDNVPQVNILSLDDKLCEQKFLAVHYRDSTGRYVVGLPFTGNCEPIFEGSREVALRRFYSIERRLSRDPTIKQRYTDFMVDYLNQGHMSLVPVSQLDSGKYYIPHHYILRPESITTDLRVVFDASAKDDHLQSLNDTLLTGAKLQADIVSILLRFRVHAVVFMADVRQMFRQILVTPEHQDYQRILWRPSDTEPLQEYRLHTVTYGLASSPFHACRVVKQLAEDEGSAYPIAKQILLSDIYVDDVVTGFSSPEQAYEAKSQLVNLCNKAHFHLRKWATNDVRVLKDVPPEDCLQDPARFDISEPSYTLKVLGLKWDPSSDSFCFDVNPSNRPCTKRSILSELARIFDPLGFLSPLTIQAKCLIQKLWILGISWDEKPPDDVVRAWSNYLQQLPLLKDFKLNRRLTLSGVRSYEIHCFCDSSEAAYSAVIYLRVLTNEGDVRVHIVASRARIAPVRKISLPRLELCSAVVLVDLFTFVKTTLLPYIKFQTVHLWTDSTVVLSWLRSHSSRWATFVANRVSHIQDAVPTECWHHISSHDNPADICSRGLLPKDLLDNSLWWAGPPWLSRDYNAWPSEVSYGVTDDVVTPSEERKCIVLVSNEDRSTDNVNQSILDKILNRFSSLEKIIRTTAFILGFIAKCQSRTSNESTFLTNIERHDALLTLVKLTTLFVQIEAVMNSRPLCPMSSDPNDLRVLTPGHFLTLEPLTAVPDHDYTDTNLHRLSRWQLIQSFHQCFWTRWKNEYLHSLTQRAKWTTNSKPLDVGSIVLIKDENHPPLHWPLGRVVELHPGPDGVVRVVTIRTARNN